MTDEAKSDALADGAKDMDKPEKKEKNRIVIRPWPKMVVLYPMFVVSILFGFLSLPFSKPDDGGQLIAVIYLFILGANLFVMAFEFNRIKSIAVFLGIMAFVLGALLLAERTDMQIMAWISSGINMIKPWANSRFYFMNAGLLAVMFVFMFIHTRLDYWEVTHQELLHHHGLMGNVERFPAPSLRITKEINDVVEFVLLFSGTLVLFPASESRTITLENVPRINRVEKDLQHLLSRLAVDFDPG